MVRAVIATVPTEFRKLIERYGAILPVEIALKKEGRDIDTLLKADQEYSNTVSGMRHFVPAIAAVCIVRQYQFESFKYRADDVICACGMSAFAGIAPYIGTIPIALFYPVSTAPRAPRGMFLDKELGALMRKAKEGKLRTRRVKVSGVMVNRIVR